MVDQVATAPCTDPVQVRFLIWGKACPECGMLTTETWEVENNEKFCALLPKRIKIATGWLSYEKVLLYYNYLVNPVQHHYREPTQCSTSPRSHSHAHTSQRQHC